MRETSSTFSHRTGPNDCLSSIAATHGFRAWRTVYENDPNRDLRDLRRNPNVLAPGDTVWIDRFERIEVRTTEARHRFVTTASSTTLHLRLDMPEPARFELRLEGDASGEPLARGAVDASSPIAVTVRPDVMTGTLWVWPARLGDERPPDSSKDLVIYELALGSLGPIEETIGVQARLRNLGLYEGPVDGKQSGATSAAIAAFETWIGVPPKGQATATLLAQLVAKHDEMK